MLKTSRRTLLQSAAVLAAPAIARADIWPSRPIRCIVALPPGGGTDSTGRLAMQALSEALDRKSVV